jgi:stringent starvation protein B
MARETGAGFGFATAREARANQGVANEAAETWRVTAVANARKAEAREAKAEGEKSRGKERWAEEWRRQ